MVGTHHTIMLSQLHAVSSSLWKRIILARYFSSLICWFLMICESTVSQVPGASNSLATSWCVFGHFCLNQNIISSCQLYVRPCTNQINEGTVRRACTRARAHTRVHTRVHININTNTHTHTHYTYCGDPAAHTDRGRGCDSDSDRNRGGKHTHMLKTQTVTQTCS